MNKWMIPLVLLFAALGALLGSIGIDNGIDWRTFAIIAVAVGLYLAGLWRGMAEK